MDSFNRSLSASANERLNAFRQPVAPMSDERRLSLRRNEVLMGSAVVLVGVLLVFFAMFRPNKNQVVIGEKTSQSQISASSIPQLLADEALIALSVEAGHFPPQLEIGDVVRIAVTPGIDGANETRVLPEEAVVSDISTTQDSFSGAIITVRAPQNVLANVAASGAIHVARVNGVDQ